MRRGLFATAFEKQFPPLAPFADGREVGKAAKDWPQLNFVIYHSAYRHVGGSPAEGMAEWDQTGRISWVSELPEIPAKYGGTNVYGHLRQLFPWSTVAGPRLAPAFMCTLLPGLGGSHVVC